MVSSTEGAEWVVTTSHFNLLKEEKKYFVACSHPVILIFNKGKFISFYYNFKLSFVHTIFVFRDLDYFVSYI
jgi:hypothetical protein